MSRILERPAGKIDNISFLGGKWEDMARRHDGRIARQALADDMQRAIMMDMRPAGLDKHLVLAESSDVLPG